ncbi:MAG: phosphoribosyltransferase family protein [Methanothrix sp.]|nr:phosphoribosyltransferase family protein [Methanothrix sp.]
MRFKDRWEAGRILASRLAGYKGGDAIVYALPRGGVVLGYEVSRVLNAPLDLVITRKIGYPGNEECAVCAVAEDGDMICDRAAASLVDPGWLSAQAERGILEAKRMREIYLGGREQLSAEGKVAIVVDDGVATGLSMLLAIQELAEMRPERVVVAVPVASPDAASRIREEADELIALQVPSGFMAVGEYYEHFPQLSDEEVIGLLRRARDMPSC